MLQFRLSLSRQSNPSILTAGLFPKFALMHPPFLADDDGEDDDRPDETDTKGGEMGLSFSSPNRAS